MESYQEISTQRTTAPSAPPQPSAIESVPAEHRLGYVDLNSLPSDIPGQEIVVSQWATLQEWTGLSLSKILYLLILGTLVVLWFIAWIVSAAKHGAGAWAGSFFIGGWIIFILILMLRVYGEFQCAIFTLQKSVMAIQEQSAKQNAITERQVAMLSQNGDILRRMAVRQDEDDD